VLARTLTLIWFDRTSPGQATSYKTVCQGLTRKSQFYEAATVLVLR